MEWDAVVVVVADIAIVASAEPLGFFLCLTTHTIQQTIGIKTTTPTTMPIINAEEEEEDEEVTADARDKQITK